MARVRTRWNIKDRIRSVEQIASALSVNIWRIASEGLLNLENEGFETISHSQRLDVIAEFVAFLIHVTDRLVYASMDQQDRHDFINALARHLTDIVQHNRVDANGPGNYKNAFIELLNARMSDYSECSFSEEEGPGFSLRRTLGEHVRAQMGRKDNKWIPDYVMDSEVPKALASLKRAIGGLLGESPKILKSPVPEGGVWGEE